MGLENNDVKGSKAADTNAKVERGWRESQRDIGHDTERERESKVGPVI